MISKTQTSSSSRYTIVKEFEYKGHKVKHILGPNKETGIQYDDEQPIFGTDAWSMPNDPYLCGHPGPLGIVNLNKY